MIALIIVLSSIALAFKKFIFPKSTTSTKVILVSSIGLLVVALMVGFYISNKEPNIYELLDVGRMIGTNDLLKLIRRNESLGEYYEEVRLNQYETRCLNESNSDWMSDSFYFYGTSLITVNIVSFTSTGTSRLMLLLVLLTLGLEFCIFTQVITLKILKFTACEMIYIVRNAFPGLALITFLLAVIRQDRHKEDKTRFNQNFCNLDEDFKALDEYVKEEWIFEGLDTVDILNKIYDDEAKESAPDNKMKKYIKYGFSAFMIYHFFFAKS